ncbi:conserved hypothetical protein [delta proteobacterium NaphS2]|nr:conserved hypothetical protein [delta proteobacterium NaphS2]
MSPNRQSVSTATITAAKKSHEGGSRDKPDSLLGFSNLISIIDVKMQFLIAQL